MSSLDKAFADYLKSLRGEQSYASLALKLGISESTLYRLIEQGEVCNVTWAGKHFPKIEPRPGCGRRVEQNHTESIFSRSVIRRSAEKIGDQSGLEIQSESSLPSQQGKMNTKFDVDLKDITLRDALFLLAEKAGFRTWSAAPVNFGN